MSFFEIEPMGNYHRGGMVVGGMPVGGMYEDDYGMGRPGPRSQDEKDRANASRIATALAVDTEADAILRRDPNITIRQAIAQAKEKVASGKIRPKYVKKDKDGNPIPKMTEQDILDNRKRRKEAVKAGTYVRPAPKNAYDGLRRRIGANARSTLHPNIKGFTEQDLEDLGEFLKSKGFGLLDLEGSGFWDDVYSGLKSVGSTALHLVPHLL
jgi:hypothetical protein